MARGSYPHPVLDYSDDIASVVEVHDLSVAPSQDYVEITYHLRSDDPDLRAMLDDGRARHSLRWTCSGTISTGDITPIELSRTADGVVLRGSIDQEHIRHSVDLDMRVLAARDLDGLRWTRQHSDYGRATFDLKAGDVIAEVATATFNPRKLYDPLNPPVGSCFRFVRNDKLANRIKVSFVWDDQVEVQLAPHTFEAFGQLAHRADMQIALVVLPALLRTLLFLRDNARDGDEAEDLSARAWAVAIQDMADGHGGLDKDLLDLAQRILESPTDRALLTGMSPEDDR